MNIVELVDSLEIGGAEKMVVDLTEALSERGHTTAVVCLRKTGPLAASLQAAGIEVLTLEKCDGFSLEAASTLTRYLRQRQPNVLHSHNPLVHHYAALCGRKAGVPIVVNTFHGPGNLTGYGRKQAIFDLSCLFSDRVVACCQAVQTHLTRVTCVAKRKLTVIPNGISMDRFRNIEHTVPSKEVVFGAVGRLAPEKDHATLLEAFALVGAHPGSRLEFLGDGRLRQSLEQRVQELGIADRVVFHGASLDVPRFLSRIHVFAISSVSEGLPLTLIEAMAAGLPVVGTRVGAISELVEAASCGWLCVPGQAQSLADALRAALQSGSRALLGEKGRAYVLAHNTIETMTAQYENLFQTLLTSRHGVAVPKVGAPHSSTATQRPSAK
jgi:glycosyltransferase involved in cell wall biosynthesis